MHIFGNQLQANRTPPLVIGSSVTTYVHKSGVTVLGRNHTNPVGPTCRVPPSSTTHRPHQHENNAHAQARARPSSPACSTQRHRHDLDHTRPAITKSRFVPIRNIPRCGRVDVSSVTVCANWLALRQPCSHPAAAQSTARARCSNRRPSPSCR